MTSRDFIHHLCRLYRAICSAICVRKCCFYFFRLSFILWKSDACSIERKNWKTKRIWKKYFFWSGLVRVKRKVAVGIFSFHYKSNRLVTALLQQLSVAFDCSPRSVAFLEPFKNILRSCKRYFWCCFSCVLLIRIFFLLFDMKLYFKTKVKLRNRERKLTKTKKNKSFNIFLSDFH